MSSKGGLGRYGYSSLSSLSSSLGGGSRSSGLGLGTAAATPSSSTPSLSPSRPPILIELCGPQVKVGYVGQSHPRHLASFAPSASWPAATLASGATTAATTTTTTTTRTTRPSQSQQPLNLRTAKDLYRLYCPLLIQGLNSLMISDLQDRKVVIMYDTGLYCSRTVQRALAAVLLERQANCMAISFVPSMEMAGYAVVATPAVPSCLLLFFSHANEVHCVAYASRRPLRYTYQACGGTDADDGGGFRGTGSEEKKAEGEEGDGTGPYPHNTHPSRQQYQTVGDKLDIMEQMLDDGNGEGSSILMTAIHRCLLACPRDVRKQVVHNIVVAGEVYAPKIGVRVAKQLRASLRDAASEASATTATASPRRRRQEQQQQEEEETKGTQEPVEEGKDDEEEDKPTPSQSASTVSNRTNQRTRTFVPVNVAKELAPLAGSVGVVEISTIRPDVLAWFGGSFYAHYYQQHALTTTAATATTGAARGGPAAAAPQSCFEWISRKDSARRRQQQPSSSSLLSQTSQRSSHRPQSATTTATATATATTRPLR